MNPKVSVILPVYNHEKYVREAIQSVLDQTFQDFELIIIDDASSDNSVQVIKEINDARIQLYVNEENLGACSTVNMGIENAKGELIALHHSDDVWELEKLAKQVTFLDENLEISAVFTHVNVISENGDEFTDKNHFYFNIFNQKNRSSFEWLQRFFFEGNCLCHPSVLIRKECYQKVGLYDPRFVQLPDLDMWVRLCMHYSISILPEYLVKFRVLHDAGNSSGNSIENHIRSAIEYKQILKRYLTIDSIEFLDFFSVIKKDRKGNLRSSSFEIAYTAIVGGKNIHISFGLDVLFDLMKNKGELINSGYDFNYLDFAVMTGKYDPYQVAKDCESQLLAQQRDEFASVNASLREESQLLVQQRDEFASVNASLREESQLLAQQRDELHSSLHSGFIGYLYQATKK